MPRAVPLDAPRPRRVLLLECRNFGDSVVGTGLVESLGRTKPAPELHVLTRPRFKSIFSCSPYVAAVHEAEFPMGSDKTFGMHELAQLAQTVLRLRGLQFDLVVNLMGDVRETALSWLIAPGRGCGPVWTRNHLRRRLVRAAPSGLVARPVQIATGELNMYACAATVARALGATASAAQRLYDSSGAPILHRQQQGAVGFHVSASQACREWPIESWRRLTTAVLALGVDVKIFGAPAEAQRLRSVFDSAPAERVTLHTGSLEVFFRELAGLRAFVGLDSFAIHAAYAVGVPSVMLNGANLAELIAPPGTEVVVGGAGLDCYPCFNRPTCLRSAVPYRCIRGIPVDTVVQSLKALLAESSSHSPVKGR